MWVIETLLIDIASGSALVRIASPRNSRGPVGSGEGWGVVNSSAPPHMRTGPTLIQGFFSRAAIISAGSTEAVAPRSSKKSRYLKCLHRERQVSSGKSLLDSGNYFQVISSDVSVL